MEKVIPPFCVRIDPFQWEVFYYFVTKSTRRNHFLRYLQQHGVPEEGIKESLETFDETDTANGGEHHYFHSQTKSLIVIYRAASLREQISTVVHENRHAADHLCDFLGIRDIETPAHIEGFLIEQVLKKLKK